MTGEQTIAIRVLKILERLKLTVDFITELMDTLSQAKGKAIHRGATLSGHCVVFVVSNAEPRQVWSEAEAVTSEKRRC